MPDFPTPILPESSRTLVEAVSSNRRHPGLQLDKLSTVGEMKDQLEALSTVCKTTGDNEMLRDLRQRREDVFRSIGAKSLSMRTRGALTLHLARAGVLENAGIALHPVYGFPVLPGSGLKGMTRAWAETVWAPSQDDAESAWREIETIFGWSPRSEQHKGAWRASDVEHPTGASVGRVVFHDAWPRKWPRLIPDIANNHNAGYYAKKDDAGDWHDPAPVYFLAVAPGEEFDFALSVRGKDDEGVIERARTWLMQALEWEGAGAKTAAGYGRFAPVEGDAEVAPVKGGGAPAEGEASPEGVTSLVCELRLSSPAFLAGAEQKERDCDLRPASLRGLLRWWWRTMHSGAVDAPTLRRLEAAVWGDVSSGGAVRISLDPISDGRAEQYEKSKDLLTRHGIDPPTNRKVTQGLYYASYGMAERERWFRPPGTTWRLTVTVRRGRFSNDAGVRSGRTIESEVLLEQISCALWLLARHGGAGSRSRKGFGSFRDLEFDGISSEKDCLQAGARFREICGLPKGADGRADTPSLDDAIFREWTTPWRDPWFVLEQTGMILQLFTKERQADARIPLGLPRQTGGRKLEANGIHRHASPALWSLSQSDDGHVTVRLIAFPAPRLPDRKISKETLRDLAQYADEEMKDKMEKLAREGQRPPQIPTGSPSETRPGPDTGGAEGLNPGTFVEAVLLAEKTRRGGWKAEHEPSGKRMPIQNTNDVPSDKQVGDRVELYVFSNDAFMWPTQELKQNIERKRQGKSRQRDGSRRGPGRRR